MTVAVIGVSAGAAIADDDPQGRVRGGGIDVSLQDEQKQRVEQVVDRLMDELPRHLETGSNVIERDRVDVQTPYCLGLDEGDGNGYLDCFQMEQARCTVDGSQYVINAFYLTSDPSVVHRYGVPYCSNPIDPVISDPAANNEDAPPMPVVTLADFRRLDIAPSEIESDSGGFGLIRGNTNFFATEEDQTLNTTMLGQQVAIQAVPVQWTWDYGDGSEQLSNPYPGGPQVEFNQETTTSHVYEDTGQYPVGLTTSYRGQFSVNEGPWIAIPGTAEVPSEPVTADIWRSKSKNVAEDCHENPEGWACGNPFVEG
ncbi:PKD domain-containing protein [Citricoccus muralis]|nr:PKD domain-containing protein [Citricoccus muralis]